MRLQTQFPQESQTLALYHNKKLVAVTVFWNYTDWDIEIAIASTSPKWGIRKYIKAVFRYAFGQCACDRVTVRIQDSNDKSLNMVERLGFVREGTLRQALNKEDMHIYGMLKDECRWL